MITAYPLRASELDAVREISNIGAGHAATALSKMVDAKVMISVPQISLTHVHGMTPLVPGPEEPVVGIELRLVGDFTGWTLLVFPLADARRGFERLAAGDVVGKLVLTP